MSDFNKAFQEILMYEGGYSDDKDDRGGKTQYGITEAVARRHGYQGEMKDLTLKFAKEVYKKSYWDTLRLDDIYDNKTATEIFDVSVNMGPSVAGRMLQRGLNLLNRNQATWPDIIVDGIVGVATIAVSNAIRKQDLPRLYKCINGLQFMKYVDIVEAKPKQEKFFNGWLRRV